MTIDEEAAKVAQPYFPGKLPEGDPLVEDIAAFGRRCAEQMREECAKESERLGSIGTPMLTKTGRVYQDACRDVAQAIRRVEVK